MKLLTVMVTLLLAVSLYSAPKLSFVAPAGAQYGTEVEVTLHGKNLLNVTDLVFYENGIELVKITDSKKDYLKVLLKIDKKCRPGLHTFRLYSSDQFSNLGVFSVSQFPSHKENEANSSFEAAEEINNNLTIDGIITNEDIDYFKINLKKGQSVNFEIEANRLGYGMMDLHLSLFNKNGFLISDNDDTTLHRLDPFLSHTAAEDGFCYIAVRSSEYLGHDNARYRLHVGNYPRALAAYPAGGNVGKLCNVSFILSNGKKITQQITAPDTEGIVKIYPHQNALTSPEGIPFQTSRITSLSESSPNDEKKQITESIQIPVIFDGAIEKKNDVDWFSFKADKNINLTVKVLARQLRSPLDAVLSIYTDKGKLISRQDDSPGPDSLINFKTSYSGNYYIRITDHLKDGSPHFVYRISVTEKPVFFTMSLPSTSDREEVDQALSIPAGGRKFRIFNASRSGTKGADKISFAKLPEGVSAKILPYIENSPVIPVIFSAAANAKKQPFKVSPKLSSGNGIEGKFQQNINMNYGSNNRFYNTIETDVLTLGVTDKAPFRLKIEQNPLPLPRYGYHDIKIIVERDKDFEHDVKIKLAYKNDGLSAIDQIVVKKDQASINYRINAAGNTALGKAPLIFTAESSFDGKKVDLCAPEYLVEVIDSFLSVKMDIQSVQRGSKSQLHVSLNQKSSFEGKATAWLRGLSENIKPIKMEFDKTTESLTIPVEINDKTRLGEHKNMFLSVQIPWDGKTLAQNLYTGGVVRVDAPVIKKKTVTVKKEPVKKSPQPRKLSRLEELRLLKEQEAKK